MVVRARLEEHAPPGEGKDTGRVSWESRKAEDSFLEPLGGRCSSEKGKEKMCE